MTTTLADVREALANALAGIEGLRAYEYLTDQVNPLQAMIDVEGPTQVTFSTAGAQEYTFTIIVAGQRVSERATQKAFDELRDPFHARSVKRAIEDDTGLAALPGMDYGQVGPAGRTEAAQVGAIEYLTVEWPLTVVIHEGT